MSVESGDTNANVMVQNSTFVSGSDSIFFKNSDGTLTSKSNTVTFE